jgi:hypothetical protein
MRGPGLAPGRLVSVIGSRAARRAATSFCALLGDRPEAAQAKQRSELLKAKELSKLSRLARLEWSCVCHVLKSIRSSLHRDSFSGTSPGEFGSGFSSRPDRVGPGYQGVEIGSSTNSCDVEAIASSTF